jgi:curved DNA-binding protein CbpA
MPSTSDPERLAALAALGLGPDADLSEIVSAYRRLARGSHPDTASESRPSADFAVVNAAYRLLMQKPGRLQEASRPCVTRVPARRHGGEPAGGTPGGDAPTSTQLMGGWYEPPLVAGPVIVRPLSSRGSG